MTSSFSSTSRYASKTPSPCAATGTSSLFFGSSELGFSLLIFSELALFDDIASPSDCLVASVYEPFAAQCLLILFTSSKLYCIANLTGNQKNFSHLTKLGVDLGANDRHNNRCCFNVRRYLSWIEGLTTNQYVGGSNPSRRTIFNSAA